MAISAAAAAAQISGGPPHHSPPLRRHSFRISPAQTAGNRCGNTKIFSSTKINRYNQHKITAIKKAETNNTKIYAENLFSSPKLKPYWSHLPTNVVFAGFITNNRSPFSAASHGGGGGGGGGHGRGRGGGDGDENAGERNRAEAILALAEAGRSIDSLPKDMAAVIEAGKIPASVIHRYFELEKSLILRWLLRFGGFRERLLGDDLFLAKLAMECGVGIFTKMAAELQKRGDKFSKELDFVCADVIMAFVADFMLVWLPAPTVSLRPPVSIGAGAFSKFFYNCPDNAFQIALPGTSYSLLQRFGSLVRNGAKLFAIGTGASVTGTVITNTLIRMRKAVDASFAAEAEDIPILSTGAAYGVYMSISSNLRYQTLAGIIEQRLLEPWLHNHKIMLSALCFAFRTGNTFLGSLMWVDFARWIGVQRSRE